MSEVAKYQEWSEQELNQKIFALYDQIQKVTLENLEVAQKNCELEIQIKTIEQMLDSEQIPYSQKIEAQTNRSGQTFQTKYESLLEDHIKLAERVCQIEQLLQQSNRNKGYGARSVKNSINKRPSHPTLPVYGHRKTVSKIEQRNSKFQETARYDTISRKSSKYR